MQGIDMFEMKCQRKRNTGGSGREECCGAWETDGGPYQQVGNKFLLTFTQSRARLTLPPSFIQRELEPGGWSPVGWLWRRSAERSRQVSGAQRTAGPRRR